MAEFVYANVKKEMELYGFDGVVKSHCRICLVISGLIPKDGSLNYSSNLSRPLKPASRFSSRKAQPKL